MRALPQRRGIRHRAASLPQARHQGRAVRRVPHACEHLHGGRPAARPQHPRAAARPVGIARQPERLHGLPSRPPARVGGDRHGQVVRHGVAQRPHYGNTLHAAANAGREALPSLLALADDPALPPIVKASAATPAQPHVRPNDLGAIRKLLANSDPGCASPRSA